MDKLDILNREEFVERLVTLTKRLSDNKKNASFAIDGEWGVGKSFVLDMYEEQLSKIQAAETATGKYFIVRYNCWKYDYYEEPLIAIVSTIIETVEQKTKLFPDGEKKSKILGALKAVGLSLLSMANSAIRQKTGVDLGQVFGVVKNGIDNGVKSYEQKHDYDVYFGFNKAMNALQETLKYLSLEYTIVFLVDELDRCLPEYAIKVLERLHHLTENIENIITVIAIDKTQLEASIKNSFGFEKVDTYLKKFIGFEIKLGKGKVSHKFVDKYAEYVNLFDQKLWEIEDPIEEFMQAVFQDVDARTQKRIVDRAFLIHNLLFNEPKDYTFMCMELLMLILPTCYDDAKVFTEWLKPYANNMEHSKPIIPFDYYFNEKLEATHFVEHQSFSQHKPNQTVLENIKSLYGLIVYCWCRMFFDGNNKNRIVPQAKETYEYFSKNIKELKQFLEVSKFIK